jgi:hypothetical protein
VVVANNKLVLGAIGCAFFGAFTGLTCMGVGGLGWYPHARGDAPDVAAMPESPTSGRVDLLTDGGFLDVSAGPFAGPAALDVAPETLPPVEPVEPKPAARAPTKPVSHTPAPIAFETSEPPPPAAPEEDPIISDEDVKALDAEVQQIEKDNEATATESKKKKKNR